APMPTLPVNPPPGVPRSVPGRQMRAVGVDAGDDPPLRQFCRVEPPSAELRLDPRQVTEVVGPALTRGIESHTAHMRGAEHRIVLEGPGVRPNTVERDRVHLHTREVFRCRGLVVVVMAPRFLC